MSEKTLNFIEHIIEEKLTVSKPASLDSPPEPNGCLHIGRVKPFTNFDLGNRYKAPVNRV